MIWCLIYLVVNTLSHNFCRRSFARVQQFGNCHAGRILVAQSTRLQALSMCVCERQGQCRTSFPRLVNCYCSCRKLYVDRRVSTGVLGAAAAVGSGRTLLCFFKPKNATDGARESPVLMDSSSGMGASGDVDVMATGVVRGGEGGAGAGSDPDVVVTGLVSKGDGGAGAGTFADVVATGVVYGLDYSEGAGIDIDGEAADGSGPVDRTLVHARIYYAGLRPAVREPVYQHYSSTLHGIGNTGVSWEVRINLNPVSLDAGRTASRGILSTGRAGTVEQPGGAPCVDIKATRA